MILVGDVFQMKTGKFEVESIKESTWPESKGGKSCTGKYIDGIANGKPSLWREDTLEKCYKWLCNRNRIDYIKLRRATPNGVKPFETLGQFITRVYAPPVVIPKELLKKTHVKIKIGDVFQMSVGKFRVDEIKDHYSSHNCHGIYLDGISSGDSISWMVNTLNEYGKYLYNEFDNQIKEWDEFKKVHGINEEPITEHLAPQAKQLKAYLARYKVTSSRAKVEVTSSKKQTLNNITIGDDVWELDEPIDVEAGDKITLTYNEDTGYWDEEVTSEQSKRKETCMDYEKGRTLKTDDGDIVKVISKNAHGDYIVKGVKSGGTMVVPQGQLSPFDIEKVQINPNGFKKIVLDEKTGQAESVCACVQCGDIATEHNVYDSYRDKEGTKESAKAAICSFCQSCHNGVVVRNQRKRDLGRFHDNTETMSALRKLKGSKRKWRLPKIRITRKRLVIAVIGLGVAVAGAGAYLAFGV